MIKILLIFSIMLIFISCDKNNNPDLSNQNRNNDSELESDNESDTDTAMTKEEEFSSALVQGILEGGEDTELQIYLEESIYPIIEKSDKVTFDRLSNSIYLLGFNDTGTLRNIMIQKLYDPNKGEFVFEKEEVPTSAQKQFVK